MPSQHTHAIVAVHIRQAFAIAATLIAVAAAKPARTERPSPVDRAEFGVWDIDPNGAPRLVVTTTVPLELGVTYGWRLHLTGSNANVRVREVLTLPAPPLSWGTNREVCVSVDRKIATVEQRMQPQNGWISGAIGVADGDPEGKHRLAIELDGWPVKTFEFETKQGAPLPGD